MKTVMLAAATLFALSACDKMPGAAGGSSSASKGPTQKLEIITTPEGANCVIDRNNMTVERVANTPNSTKISKDGKDLTVRCLKSGYKQGVELVKARADGTYASPVTVLLKKK